VVNPYKKRIVSLPSYQDRSLKDAPASSVSGMDTRSSWIGSGGKIVGFVTQNQTNEVPSRLRTCIFCEMVDCNGELCLKACYRCGNMRHNTGVCVFNMDELTKILLNKGVCFGCFDTTQHTLVIHDIRDCRPLKRRLKRLLFHHHD